MMMRKEKFEVMFLAARRETKSGRESAERGARRCGGGRRRRRREADEPPAPLTDETRIWDDATRREHHYEHAEPVKTRTL